MDNCVLQLGEKYRLKKNEDKEILYSLGFPKGVLESEILIYDTFNKEKNGEFEIWYKCYGIEAISFEMPKAIIDYYFIKAQD